MNFHGSGSFCREQSLSPPYNRLNILTMGSAIQLKRYTFHLSSKWTKTTALLKNSNLKSNIPVTTSWSESHLYKLLKLYKMVYLKPNKGSKGRGVIRVNQLKQSYQVRYETMIKTFSSFQQLSLFIKQKIGKEKYLIQQGIRLLTYNRSPFDLRIMVQHNPKKQWEVTGLVGRVAQTKRIVTNGSQGGSIRTVETLLSPYISSSNLPDYIRKLKTFSLSVGKQLQTVYPQIREIGLDIALDSKHKPWILEFNTSPELHPFAKLRDKRMLYKMIRYGKTYGRTSYRY